MQGIAISRERDSHVSLVRLFLKSEQSLAEITQHMISRERRSITFLVGDLMLKRSFVTDVPVEEKSGY